MANYAIIYAKIVYDKNNGALMPGIYFGGACNSKEHADELATKCVSEIQGGEIIPKVINITNQDIRKIIKDTEYQFDKLIGQMHDVERMSATYTKKSKSKSTN